MQHEELSADEYIRLECLSQATLITPTGATAQYVIDSAEKFEAYVREGKPNVDQR